MLSSNVHNVAAGFGGGGSRRGTSRPSLKKVDNKIAGKIAKLKGYKDAHDLKEDHVWKGNISEFNMKVDNNTRKYYLEGLENGVIIPIY